MAILNYLAHCLMRLRYPVSLPQEIACALGVEMCNRVRFQELLQRLTCPSLKLTKLTKYMPRDKAEYAFRGALRKERFPKNSLYSFYFNEGWLEFELQFDEHSRLRRLYIHHKLLVSSTGSELPLPTETPRATEEESISHLQIA